MSTRQSAPLDRNCRDQRLRSSKKAVAKVRSRHPGSAARRLSNHSGVSPGRVSSSARASAFVWVMQGITAGASPSSGWQANSSRFDSVSFREPIRPIAAGKNFKLVNSALPSQANQIIVPDEGLNAQPHLPVRRFIHQMTVFDASGPCGNGSLHWTRRISVHRDVGSPVFRGFDRRAQFRFGRSNLKPSRGRPRAISGRPTSYVRSRRAIIGGLR